MEKKDRFEGIWNSIDEESIVFMDSNFKAIAPVLIKHIVSSLQKEKKVKIGTFEDGEEKGSCIIFYKSNKIKLLELRYKSDATYLLALNIFKGEHTFAYYYKLTWEDVGMIPYHIHSVMREVEKTGEPKYLIVM